VEANPMSVYYEAHHTGRLAAVGWTPESQLGRHGAGARLSCKGIRRALREAKRMEAEERNADTPHERTKKHRREMEAAAARISWERVGRG
jgi:hypothetical protein